VKYVHGKMFEMGPATPFKKEAPLQTRRAGATKAPKINSKTVQLNVGISADGDIRLRLEAAPVDGRDPDYGVKLIQLIVLPSGI